MKMRLKHIIVLLLMPLMVGCDKWLEIKPKGVLLAEDAVRTPAAVQQVLTSAYDALRSDNFMGGDDWIASELLADNIGQTDLDGSLLAVYNRNSTIFTETSKNIWNGGYTVIYRCNIVLEAIKTVTGFTPQELARVRGEALFLRSYAHFELVRLFAQPYGYTADNSHLGIPLRLKTGTEAISRSTVQQVYDQILGDLNTAIQELPGDLSPGTANVWAAKAMLARIYFTINNFALAYKNAKDVGDNSPNIFGSDLRKRFAKGGSLDNVFELASTGTALPGQQSGLKLMKFYNSAYGHPELEYSKEFYNASKVDTNDLRYKYWLTFEKATGSAPDEYWPKKINSTSYFSVPLIHLGEMRLIYAESAAELSKRNDALFQLNDIRLRAGLSTFSSLSFPDIITEIRKQRRLEMVLEGDRVHELKRQAIRDKSNVFIRNSIWSCPGLVLAIPSDEMSSNPKMVQNALGGCN
jgi:starch-binding outer membrane protein, SusD/RagB family